MNFDYKERIALSADEILVFELKPNLTEGGDPLLVVTALKKACGMSFEVAYISEFNTSVPKVQIPKPLGAAVVTAIGQRVKHPFTEFYE